MDVQATLLYRTLRPVDFSALAGAFNSWIGADDMTLTLMPASNTAHILLSNPKFHAVITLTKERVDPAILASALKAPILMLKDFDYQDALRAHRMTVDILVGDGPMHLSEDVRLWMSRMGKLGESLPYPVDLKLCVLNGLVQQLLSHDLPELVYWSQSDMIFTPEEISEARDMPFPLPLAVQPVPQFDETGMMAGLRLEESAEFLGRTLVMEPSTLPFGEVTGIAMWLMNQRIEGKLQMEHGAVLETPGFPTLYLRHEMPDAYDPRGRIVITQTQPDPYAVAPGFLPNPYAQALQKQPQPTYPASTAAQSPAMVQPAPQNMQSAPVTAQAAPQPQQTDAPMYFTSERVQQPPAYVQPAAQAQTPMPPLPEAWQLAQPQDTQPAQHAPTPQETPQPQQAEPAAQTQPQPEPQVTAQPVPQVQAPPPQQAAGWANGARKGVSLSSAVQAAASQPKRTVRAPAATAAVPLHHDVDVAANLSAPKPAAPAQGAMTKQAAPAEQSPAQSPAPKATRRGLLRALPTRAISGVLAFALILMAGLTLAPHVKNGLEQLASSQGQSSSLTVVAGPDIPGLPAQ